MHEVGHYISFNIVIMTTNQIVCEGRSHASLKGTHDESQAWSYKGQL